MTAAATSAPATWWSSKTPTAAGSTSAPTAPASSAKTASHSGSSSTNTANRSPANIGKPARLPRRDRARLRAGHLDGRAVSGKSRRQRIRIRRRAARRAAGSDPRAATPDLPVPATSEIVIEGEMPPPEEESHTEGPFGEWPGYYTHSGEECVVRVKQNSPSQRSDPARQSAAACRSPSATAFRSMPRASGITWSSPASPMCRGSGATATL